MRRDFGADLLYSAQVSPQPEIADAKTKTLNATGKRNKVALKIFQTDDGKFDLFFYLV